MANIRDHAPHLLRHLYAFILGTAVGLRPSMRLARCLARRDEAAGSFPATRSNAARQRVRRAIGCVAVSPIGGRHERRQQAHHYPSGPPEADKRSTAVSRVIEQALTKAVMQNHSDKREIACYSRYSQHEVESCEITTGQNLHCHPVRFRCNIPV